MQAVIPTARAYANYVTQIGASPAPNDGQDAVQASTVVSAVLSLGNTDAYLAATALGPQYAPPLAQPPAFASVDANGFYANGVQRIRTINSVASVATTLAALAGHPGDLAALVFGGSGATWGIYMLIPGTFQTPDAFTCVNQVSIGTGQWVLVGPGKSLITAVGGSSSYAARLAQLSSGGLLTPTLLPQTGVAPTIASVTTPIVLSTLVQANWTASTDAALWRDAAGTCHMKGFLTAAGGSSTQALLGIPTGYKPAAGTSRSYVVPALLVSTLTAVNAVVDNLSGPCTLILGTLGGSFPAYNDGVYWLDGISWLGEV